MKWPSNAVQTTLDSPLGLVRLCATPQGLAGLWFHNGRHMPEPTWFQRWPIHHQHPLLRAIQRQLKAYFSGDIQPFELTLDLSSGTAFQREVWHALQDIPVGKSASYGDVAQRIGRPAAVRAVGAAIGRNPINIIVPCHRVLGASGALTGYAGGLDRKSALLQHEGTLSRKTQD